MTLILNYSSVVKSKVLIESKFGGSSKYKVVDDELITINHKKKEKVSSKQDKELKISLSSLNNQNSDFKNEEIIKEESKIYKLNKSKVRKKCYAISRLKRSKKFLAFYTVTYPIHLSDECCYKLFNTWLTRCRKNNYLTTYLWVAERQKNGTIHFHLLTNDFMEIRIINSYMAAALKTEKKKRNDLLKEFDTEKYNGIDVQKVGKSKKGIITYLAKYVSKNNIEFYRLPWHCSRNVSRLFTSTNFNNTDEDLLYDKLPETIDNYTEIKENDFYIAAGFKFKPDEKLYEDLDGMNELIYDCKNN